MQISAKHRLSRVVAGSILAAGTVLIPPAVAGAEVEDGRGGLKAPPQLPDVPTDPVESLPLPTPGGD
jgi:hypothetical protein